MTSVFKIGQKVTQIPIEQEVKGSRLKFMNGWIGVVIGNTGSIVHVDFGHYFPRAHTCNGRLTEETGRNFFDYELTLAHVFVPDKEYEDLYV